MAQNKMQMPGAFGGLMRYDEEYKSRFMLSPIHIIAFIVAIIIFVIVLKILFPISFTAPSAPIPNPAHNFILPILGI